MVAKGEVMRVGAGRTKGKQTNERQAQIQPQVGEAEPGDYRGVALL